LFEGLKSLVEKLEVFSNVSLLEDPLKIDQSKIF
jgi:hypothetical protein